MSDRTKVQAVTTYVPGVYEVIHPTMERIGTVERWYGPGRRRSWDALDASGKPLETFDVMRDAVAAVVERAEAPDAR